MKRILLWLIAVALAIPVWMLIRRRDNLDVSPSVREQIEKAKRR